MSDFLSMGGYGAYVWTAFGFAFVVLIGVLIHSLKLAKQREAELAQLRELTRRGGTEADGEPAPEALSNARPITPRRPSEAAGGN